MKKASRDLLSKNTHAQRMMNETFCEVAEKTKTKDKKEEAKDNQGFPMIGEWPLQNVVDHLQFWNHSARWRSTSLILETLPCDFPGKAKGKRKGGESGKGGEEGG